MLEQKLFEIFINQLKSDNLSSEQVVELVYCWIGSFCGEALNIYDLIDLIEEKMEDYQYLFDYYEEEISDAADKWLSIEMFGL